VTERTLLNQARPRPQEVLEEGLTDFFGRPARIVGLETLTLAAGTEYPLERLRVTLASGEALSVIFKRLLPDPDPVGPTYMREVLIYRRLLAGGRFGAPALYASLQDDAREQYWLFVEDLGDSTLEDGDVEDWLAAARWLAGLHREYRGREEELQNLGCLGEHGTDFYRTLAAKARRNLALAGASDALGRFDKLMRRFESVVDALISRPRTLVHGDFGAHNIALAPGGRIRPIDWEWAAIGPGAWDLARLLYGWWPSRELLEAYAEELGRGGTRGVDLEELTDSVRRCDFVYKVWFLSQQPDVARDSIRVDELLDEMEAAR